MSPGNSGPLLGATSGVARGAKTNLRELATTFFGRAIELAHLDWLLGGGLVTVLGPAGCGKTRLVKRYAALHLSAFDQAGGAWFCDLTEARTMHEVVACVVQALGVRLERPVEPDRDVEQLGRVLNGYGPVLVILDNCEQVVSDVARVLSAWTADAPAARFLTSSRERLGIDGERIFDLSPLPLPGSDADVTSSEAVQLFLDRARLVSPDYSLSEADAPVVAQIVRALDGLPLAIELAAARMRVMTARALLGRLNRRFEVLRATRRGAPGHHATLRGAIGWSWGLLADWEQAALRQCAVFRGTFAIEAAEAVVDLSAFDGPPTALDALQALRDKSLVHAEPSPGLPSELRFGLYESIREYAAEKLADSGEAEGVHARHASYFLRTGADWAERVEVGSAEHIQRLALELENLRAVHERALADSPDDAMRAALILAHVYQHRGPSAVLHAMLDATVGATADESGHRPRGGSLSLFAEVLLHRAHARYRLGLADDAKADANHARGLARDAKDVLVEARAEHRLGLLASSANDASFDAAIGHFVAAREGFRAAGRTGLEAWMLIEIAIVNSKAGRVAAAHDLYVKVLDVAQRAGAERAAAKAYYGLGTTLHELGMLAEAQSALERATAAFLRLGDSFQYFLALVYRGFVHHERGDLTGAESAYREVLGASIGVYPIDRGLASAALGALLASRGRVEGARRALDEADSELETFAAEWPVVARVMRGHLDLALAREHAAAGRDRAASDCRKSAEQRIAQATEWVARSDDARMALRWLERALEIASSERHHPQDALVVAEDGAWFRVPFGWRVEVRGRPHERALLGALARQRVDAPGRPLSVPHLLSAGWPGERVLPRAGASRVYVAVSTLRQLGLRNMLRSAPGGYLLDPDLPTVVAEQSRLTATCGTSP
jgi:predicted ATPase